MSEVVNLASTSSDLDWNVQCLICDAMAKALSKVIGPEAAAMMRVNPEGHTFKDCNVTIAMTINGHDVPFQAVMTEWCEAMVEDMEQRAKVQLMADDSVVEYRRKVHACTDILRSQLERIMDATNELFPKKEPCNPEST